MTDIVAPPTLTERIETSFSEGWSHDVTRPAAGQAVAREDLRDDPGGRGLDLRTEVGRFPHARLPRREEHRTPEPSRSPDGSLLPRDGRTPARTSARPLCRRRRDHHAG